MKTVITLLMMSFAVAVAQGQQMKIKWSDQLKLNSGETGFAQKIVGYNSEFIYVKFTNSHRSKNKYKKGLEKQKVRIVGYERSTMKPKLKLDLKGFGKAKDDKNMNDLIYRQTIANDQFVYIFWSKRDGNRDITYAQTFDKNLKKVSKLKKVYDVLVEKRGQAASGVFILYNEAIPDKIIIGSESGKENNKNVTVECRILDSQLSFTESAKFELPLEKTGRKTNQLSSGYLLGEDGMVYITSAVELESEDDKNNSRYFTMLSIADPNTGDIVSIPIRDEEKSIKNVFIEVSGGEVYISGVYFEKEKKSFEPKGLFFATYSTEERAISSLNFSPFEGGFIDQVRSQLSDVSDINNRKSKNQEKLTDFSLYDLHIEHIEPLDNGEKLVLFTIRNSYVVTNCNSQGQCTTTYHCDKKTVIAAQVNANNEILLTRTVPRSMHYYRLEVFDINCIPLGNQKFLVTFGSNTINTVENGKTKVVKNPTAKRERNYEYAILDLGNGSFEKYSSRVNPDGTTKADLKIVNPDEIVRIDDKLYVYSRNIYKPIGAKLAIIPSLLVWPTLFLQSSPKLRTGYGYLGEIYVD